MKHEEIAIGLGIQVDTLRKYYEAELSVVANRRRMEVLQGLHKAARRGSSGAAKAYLALAPQLAAPPLPPAPPEQPDKPVVEGKKAQAQAAAGTAQVGTEWAEILPRGPVQ